MREVRCWNDGCSSGHGVTPIISLDRCVRQKLCVVDSWAMMRSKYAYPTRLSRMEVVVEVQGPAASF